ncbi:MAG: hypothetical protein ACXWRA_07515 [Pseudobdellovibrionaceae bacterium]
MEGGGGKAVVCRDLQGAIKSVELLDLWEARTLFDKKISSTISAHGLEAAVDSVLKVLKDSYPWRGEGTIGTTKCVDQECILKRLKQRASYFLKSSSNVKRLHGVTLELTDDSYEIAKPESCNIEQIVNYQPNDTIFINQDLYDKLDLTNKIALIAHESYYAVLRSYAKETNSIRTRRAIGYVMSGQYFNLQVPAQRQEYLFCYNLGVPYAPTYVDFFMKKDDSTGAEFLAISPTLSRGSPFIGLEKTDVEFKFLNRQDYSQFVSGKCQRDGADNSFFSIRMDGPVEFDREIRLDWVCKAGVYSLYLTESKPGFQDPMTIPMSCQSRP